MAPMGMQSGVIEDHQLSASTSQPFHDATQSRLGIGAGWMFAYGDTDPWISVEFIRMAHIKAIVVVGKVCKIDNRIELRSITGFLCRFNAVKELLF